MHVIRLGLGALLCVSISFVHAFKPATNKYGIISHLASPVTYPAEERLIRLPGRSHLGLSSVTTGDVWKEKDLSFLEKCSRQWRASCVDIRKNPRPYVTIPIVAALVGYITNFVGVKMLFYPAKWTGIPIKRWTLQPFGLVGWQGVVPCKRYVMSARMVDVTISRLLDVKEVFARLQPHAVSEILQTDVKNSILGGWIPTPVVNFLLRRTSKDIIANVEKVVDVKTIVVGGLCADRTTLSYLFQKVAKTELDFLVNSGLVFGFLLGMLQMLQWMLYPANWTLLAGGSLVGFITNWIALKWIFEPLNPTKVGPFVFQGMFLRRQKQVSADFCEFIAQNLLTSRSMWAHMVAAQPFREIVGRNVPLKKGGIDAIIHTLKDRVIPATTGAGAALHEYTSNKLDVQRTLTNAMNKLSTEEFEQVLHPIFQEDELTLIMAGAVLGALTGGLQWLWNMREAVVEKEGLKGKRV